jgi:hypothetical protein
MDFNNPIPPTYAMRQDMAHYYTNRHQYPGRSQRQLYPPLGENYKRFFFPSEFVPEIDSGPQTVEQILRHGYMDVPAWNSEFGMIQDKQHTFWLGLDDILGQIRQRESIYRKNMLDIEWDTCYAFNELARGGWPASHKQWELYQKRLGELRTQQRMERVSAWQHTSNLRQMLPESIQLYLSASRKSELLNEPDGDAP